MAERLHSVLSIAGSDPTGGAGIQADIRTGSLMGCHVLTAITAVTAQNSKGVSKIMTVSPGMLREQLDDIIEDVTPNAIKIGMVGSADNIKEIFFFLSRLNSEMPIVVDPVLKSTAGDFLLNDGSDILKAYHRYLFPLATVITPNRYEAEMIGKEYPMVIKGGDTTESCIEDILTVDGKVLSYRHQKIDSINLHGTGCVYSTLLASYLALGRTLTQAFMDASVKMSEIISRSTGYRLGASGYGPLNINNYKI